MLRWIDQSEFLIKLLGRLSNFLARQRGLPIVAGVALIAIGFVLELVNISAQSHTIETIHVILRNGGLITALIGILLAEPLGK